MENNVNKLAPGPDERPDLYDYYDGIDRPEGWKNPVALPERLQKMLDDRRAKQQQPVAAGH